MAELTLDQLTELRAIIDDDLRVLKRSMKISEETSVPVTLDQSSVGRLSRMDAMQSQAMQSELHDRELGRLGALESAVRRLNEGTYGSCTSCSAAIPFGRLLVVPEARTCVKCGPRG